MPREEAKVRMYQQLLEKILPGYEISKLSKDMLLISEEVITDCLIHDELKRVLDIE